MKMNRLFSREFRWMICRGYRVLQLRRRTQGWRAHLRAWQRFWNSYRAYVELAGTAERQSLLDYLYPCLDDDGALTPIEPIYFYQDAWAFEHIVRKRPADHVDVGSHHKFVALLSKVVPLTMVDIRPLSHPLDTISFRQGSILKLPYEDASVSSVSSLCVVEHIGLGRYGDPLDPHGTGKAIEELKRIVKPGGDLYISVPLHDENRTYFNAHRAFSESYLRELFAPFKVVEVRYIYGGVFCDSPGKGFGTGCFQLQNL